MGRNTSLIRPFCEPKLFFNASIAVFVKVSLFFEETKARTKLAFDERRVMLPFSFLLLISRISSELRWPSMMPGDGGLFRDYEFDVFIALRICCYFVLFQVFCFSYIISDSCVFMYRFNILKTSGF